MPYKVTLKKREGNDISNILGVSVKTFTVNDLTITNNCIQKGSYLLPITNVLFIEEE